MRLKLGPCVIPDKARPSTPSKLKDPNGSCHLQGRHHCRNALLESGHEPLWHGFTVFLVATASTRRLRAWAAFSWLKLAHGGMPRLFGFGVGIQLAPKYCFITQHLSLKISAGPSSVSWEAPMNCMLAHRLPRLKGEVRILQAQGKASLQGSNWLPATSCGYERVNATEP